MTALNKQIDLGKILRAIDLKDRDFYDNLTDEEKKSFSAFLMTRYAGSVEGSEMLQYAHIISANHYANKYMFDLHKHPKLQWLMLTASSLGMGVQRHKWIPFKKKTKNTTDEIRKKLDKLFPNMKEEDLDVMCKLLTKKELKQFIEDNGGEW